MTIPDIKLGVIIFRLGNISPESYRQEKGKFHFIKSLVGKRIVMPTSLPKLLFFCRSYFGVLNVKNGETPTSIWVD